MHLLSARYWIQRTRWKMIQSNYDQAKCDQSKHDQCKHKKKLQELSLLKDFIFRGEVYL